MFQIETIQPLLVSAMVLVPVITGIVEVVKRATGLKGRFLPLVAVIVGGILGFFFVQATGVGAIVGVILGLGSVGLFEFGATTVKGN